MLSETQLSWLQAQSAGVRTELENLLAYKPEPEFIEMLTEGLPVVPQVGLIDLYYDIFYCCPPVFAIAIRQLHTADELSDFLLLAERTLLDAADIAAFSTACSADDDVDAVIFWLKRHAGRRQQ